MLRALKFVVGLVAGLAILYAMTPGWLGIVADAAEPLVRLDPRLRHSIIWIEDGAAFVRSTTGTPAPVRFPVDQLIYNLPLLIALFFSNDRPFGRRNLQGFFIAVAVLLASHPVSLFIAVESTYATRMGAWSERNYSDLAANVWIYLEMFWRLIGMFALPFALWWGAPEKQRVAT